jgi:hypothetical protein
MKDEALRLALEALNDRASQMKWQKAREAVEQALAQPEQEPVAWLITDHHINELQIDSIRRLIDRAKHAHMTDIKLRINGQDEWYEADWLKHMTRTSPPKREWQGLTDVDVSKILDEQNGFYTFEKCFNFAKAIEAKLKERNT